MSDLQLDVNKIIESLTNQIAAQAQRIAVLEATINAIQSTAGSVITKGEEDKSS
jgi:EAL domain-containing protein (putative c-di-GMP-specific phosphodiesterase class I)